MKNKNTDSKSNLVLELYFVYLCPKPASALQPSMFPSVPITFNPAKLYIQCDYF